MSNPNIRTSDIVVQPLDGELLIYDLRTDRAHRLNDMAAHVYQVCNGLRSIAEIRIAASEKAGRNVPEATVLVALEQLEKNGLMEKRSVDVELTTFNRRSMLRQIGIAGAALIPIVTSLSAPRAAEAASCTPAGGPCDLGNPGACCTQACHSGNPNFCCSFGAGPFPCFNNQPGEVTTAKTAQSAPVSNGRPEPPSPIDEYRPKR
jgi:hypothetical protein